MENPRLIISYQHQQTQLPDRCRACPRVETIATEQAQALINREYISNDLKRDQTAKLMPDAIAEVEHDFPSMSEDWIIDQAQKRVAMDLRSDTTARNLMKAGEILNKLNETVEITTNKIQDMVENCPPEGCASR